MDEIFFVMMLQIFMKVFLDFHVICGDVFKFIDHQWEYWQKILCDPGEI